MKRRIHGVEDILLGFEPKDAGSIPAGSAVSGRAVVQPLFVPFLFDSCSTRVSFHAIKAPLLQDSGALVFRFFVTGGPVNVLKRILSRSRKKWKNEIIEGEASETATFPVGIATGPPPENQNGAYHGCNADSCNPQE